MMERRKKKDTNLPCTERHKPQQPNYHKQKQKSSYLLGVLFAAILLLITFFFLRALIDGEATQKG